MYKLIGDDLKRIDKHRLGMRVWSQWINHQNDVIGLVQVQKTDSVLTAAKTDALKRQLQNAQNMEYSNYHELRNIHWVARTFDHATLVQAILRLTELQYEVVRYRTLVLEG